MGWSATVHSKKKGLEPIPKDIREYVLKRDHYKCVFCGKPATEVHHIFSRNSIIPAYLEVPRVRRNSHPFNLVSVCHECHMRIHSKGMPKGMKEAMIKNNKNIACIHFDEELEERMKKAVEEIKI